MVADVTKKSQKQTKFMFTSQALAVQEVLLDDSPLIGVLVLPIKLLQHVGI